MRMGFDLGAVLPETTQWRYASDAQNHVRLKFDADMLKENPLVEWSTPVRSGNRRLRCIATNKNSCRGSCF
jgi:hypothetical protein